MKLFVTAALLLLVNSPPVLTATIPLISLDRQEQQLLHNSQADRQTTNSNTKANYLDAAPNTVGLIFMNTKNEGVHVWLPIGEKVYVRTFSHPHTLILECCSP